MKNKFKNLNPQSGQSMLEIILALAIFALIAGAMISLSLGGFTALEQGGEHLEAEFLMQETIESLRSIRHNAWNEFVYDTSAVSIAGGRWIFDGEGTSETIGQYTREINFENVCRDLDNEVVACPGDYTDVHTKKAIIEISWSVRLGVDNNITREIYLTNWDSKNWIEDLSADFSDGTFDSTEISETLGDGDGAITLEFSGGETYPSWECVSRAGFLNLGSDVDEMEISGDYLYLSQGSQLASFSLIDPSSPTSLDSINLGGTINKIFIQDNYAYVATSGDELIIVDITNPSNLIQIGSYDTTSNSDGTSVFVVGNRAYLTTMGNWSGDGFEFYILDISNPSVPSLISGYDVGGDTNDVYVGGNYAYLATANASSEITILDITSETAIALLGSVDISGSKNLNNLDFQDGYLYATTDWWAEEFYSINVTDPSLPILADTLIISGTNYLDLLILGDYAILGATKYDQELLIIDITDPTNLVEFNSFDFDNYANAVAVYQNTLFVGNDNNSEELIILESNAVESWACFEQVGQIDLPSTADGLQVKTEEVGAQTFAYIVQTWNGGVVTFYIYDISDLTLPVLLDSYTASDAINDFYIDGNYAYLATSIWNKEMIILDISDRSNIIETGSYDSDEELDGLGIFAVGDRAYLTTDLNRGRGDAEFYILDVSDPTNPVLANPDSKYDFIQDIRRVYVEGDYAYVTTDSNSEELAVFDISDETNIVDVSSGDTPGGSRGEDLFVSGDYAYVVNGSGNDLAIFDISDPTNVIERGVYSSGDDLLSVFVDGDYAFVAGYDGQEEMQIIDISDKDNPVFFSSFNNDYQYAYWVCVFDNYIFLANADDNAEVKIIGQKEIAGPGGGGGGGAYATSGTYTSNTFDLGSTAHAIQTIEWNQAEPICSGCDIQFEIRSADSETNLLSEIWGGPTGAGSFYEIAKGNIISEIHNGDRWVQYRATLTGNGSQSPVLEEVRINYR